MAVHQFSRNHAVATSLPISGAIPIAITGQNAPAKIAVSPSMEKAAETPVSASAADSVANITGVLRCLTAETGVTRVTGSVTVSVTPAVTPRSVTSGVGKNTNASIKLVLKANIDRQKWMRSTGGTTHPMDFNGHASFVVRDRSGTISIFADALTISTTTHHRLPNMSAPRKDANTRLSRTAITRLSRPTFLIFYQTNLHLL
jgi:hypothetical protein